MKSRVFITLFEALTHFTIHLNVPSIVIADKSNIWHHYNPHQFHWRKGKRCAFRTALYPGIDLFGNVCKYYKKRGRQDRLDADNEAWKINAPSCVLSTTPTFYSSHMKQRERKTDYQITKLRGPFAINAIITPFDNSGPNLRTIKKKKGRKE